MQRKECASCLISLNASYLSDWSIRDLKTQSHYNHVRETHMLKGWTCAPLAAQPPVHTHSHCNFPAAGGSWSKEACFTELNLHHLSSVICSPFHSEINSRTDTRTVAHYADASVTGCPRTVGGAFYDRSTRKRPLCAEHVVSVLVVS